MGQLLRELTRKFSGGRKSKQAIEIPIAGYEDHRYKTKFVDSLDDDDLARLNKLLPWHAFTIDQHGRRFGDAAWEGKRDVPEMIPDRRVVLMNERFGLTNKHVLEVGCFEGIHTVALAANAREVTAIDARIENVVKTIVRCAFFGYHPTVFKCNVEVRPLDCDSLRSDIAFHVGVLYHLRDPVQHLFDLADFIRDGLLLDTHFALAEDATERYGPGGVTFRYKRYREGGDNDPFSGVYDHAKWLQLDDIVGVLRRAGFSSVDIVETRRERNGPRALLIAKKA